MNEVVDLNTCEKKYRVIYCDPPWSFKVYSKKGMGRSAENHYPCMNLKDIQKLPIDKIADKDSLIFMWVTDPFLKKGMNLLSIWGFEYKTVGFYWVKENKKSETDFVGLGYYTRANPEQCLIGKKGKGVPRKSKNVRRLIRSKIREHSRKPDEIYDRIEQLVDGPYIELFSRTKRENWDCWGLETGKF